MPSLITLVIGALIGLLVVAAVWVIPHEKRTTRSAINRYTGWGRGFAWAIGLIILVPGGAALYLWYREHPLFSDYFALGSGLLALAAGLTVIAANRAASARISAFLEQERLAAEAAAVAAAAPKKRKKKATGKRLKKRTPVLAAPAEPVAEETIEESVPCPICRKPLVGIVAACPSCGTEFDGE